MAQARLLDDGGVVARSDHELILFDARGKQTLKLHQGEALIHSLAVRSDRKVFAVASTAGARQVVEWYSSHGGFRERQDVTLGEGDTLRALAFLPGQEDRLAALSNRHQLLVLTPGERNPGQPLPGGVANFGGPAALVFSADGARLYTTTYDSGTGQSASVVWDSGGGDNWHPSELPGQSLPQACCGVFTADHQQLLVGTALGRLFRVWPEKNPPRVEDLAAALEKDAPPPLGQMPRGVVALRWLKGGLLCARGGESAKIQPSQLTLWSADYTSRRTLKQLDGQGLRDLDLDPDGPWALICECDEQGHARVVKTPLDP